MQVYYVLRLLTFGAFALTTTSGFHAYVTPRFEKLQYHINLISDETFAKFREMNQKIAFFGENLKKQLISENRAREKVFIDSRDEIVEKAKAQAKGVDLAHVESCIDSAREKYLNDIRNSHSKSVTCVGKATAVALNKVHGAKLTFESNSFSGESRAAKNDFKLHKCYAPIKYDCVEKKALEYLERIRVTQVVSKQTIATCVAAHVKQHDAANECFGIVYKEVDVLQEKHNKVVYKCIINP